MPHRNAVQAFEIQEACAVRKIDPALLQQKLMQFNKRFGPDDIPQSLPTSTIL